MFLATAQSRNGFTSRRGLIIFDGLYPDNYRDIIIWVQNYMPIAIGI